MRLLAPTLALALVATAARPGLAQAILKASSSTRATTEVSLMPPRANGQPAPKALKVRIDYGQPHARGRAVAGALADDLGKVWRLGANEATSLTSDVNLDIGGTAVPKGSYTLFAETSKGAWKLIISKKTGEWGTDYDPTADLARIPLKSTPLATPLESLSIWLIPAADGAHGELRFGWGTMTFSTTWMAK